MTEDDVTFSDDDGVLDVLLLVLELLVSFEAELVVLTETLWEDVVLSCAMQRASARMNSMSVCWAGLLLCGTMSGERTASSVWCPDWRVRRRSSKGAGLFPHPAEFCAAFGTDFWVVMRCIFICPTLRRVSTVK